MSASAIDKQLCVSCNKSSGIFICAGCQQAFCGKHVAEHRQDLSAQLDDIMQEHDLIQQELLQTSSKKNPILKKIDKWEKDSIAKIQLAAEIARKELQEQLEKSKEKLTKTCRDMAEKLCATREADDFSEKDLERWKQKLKEIQSELKEPSSTKLVPIKNSSICLMTLKTKESPVEPKDNEQPNANTTTINPSSTLQDIFFESLGPVNIAENGYLATHVGAASIMAYYRGSLLYSEACHTIRFQLEKSKHPYRIFFGCMSSKTALKEDVFKSSDCFGWFGSNQTYQNGRCSCNVTLSGYNSSKIKAEDVISLIINCTNKRITLFNERMKKECTISVNETLAPFPWQFLMVLYHPGDSVRILSNA